MSEVSEVDVGVDDEPEVNVPCRSPEPPVVDDRIREDLEKHSIEEHKDEVRNPYFIILCNLTTFYYSNFLPFVSV